jgi:hypothetical protein
MSDPGFLGAAEAAVARGAPLGPLHGVPMTITNSFENAGLRMTSGSPTLAHQVPAADAAAVARLEAAGAIVFGKTNLPAFAMDTQSYNPLLVADSAVVCCGKALISLPSIVTTFSPRRKASATNSQS